MTSLTHLGELCLLWYAVVGRKVHRFDEVESSHVDLEHAAVVAMGDVSVLEILVRELSKEETRGQRRSEARKCQRKLSALSCYIEI